MLNVFLSVLAMCCFENPAKILWYYRKHFPESEVDNTIITHIMCVIQAEDLRHSENKRDAKRDKRY